MHRSFIEAQNLFRKSNMFTTKGLQSSLVLVGVSEILNLFQNDTFL